MQLYIPARSLKVLPNLVTRNVALAAQGSRGRAASILEAHGFWASQSLFSIHVVAAGWCAGGGGGSAGGGRRRSSRSSSCRGGSRSRRRSSVVRSNFMFRITFLHQGLAQFLIEGSL